MASIQLTTLWLTDGVDLTDSISFPLMSSLKASILRAGQTRLFAGGRLRSISTAGAQQQLDVTLPACTPAQVAWLRAHEGVLVLARDDRGRRVWGTYGVPNSLSTTAGSSPSANIGYAEHPYDGLTDVQLTIGEVTHDETV